MSAPPTGDLKNLLLQLYSTLRAVDYTPTLDPQELCTGTPALYLHLLHYLLLDAFPTFAAHLATSGHDLRGKRDARFLQGCYRVLRDEFSYKPALTRDQFFLPGFAARKIMLVMDVARKVQEWARDRDRRVKLSSSSLPSSAPQRRPTPLAARVQHQQQLRPADISYTLPEPASPSSAPAKSSPPMRPASVSPGTTAYDPRIHWADDHNDHDDNDGPELAAAAAAEANSFLEHLGHRRPESALSRSSPPPHVPTAETAEAAAALVHIQSTLAALDASLRGMQARLDAVENAHLQVADARVRAERAEAENAVGTPIRAGATASPK
ncbi:Centrosomal spindle body, CEP44-domain-containing protein [Blastocladiella britannica]|nr:Centrosomal spindle body, CEP44-domain-containing protein [Blastocladiella britannica]